MAVRVHALCVPGVGRLAELVPIGRIEPDVRELLVHRLAGKLVGAVEVLRHRVPLAGPAGVQFPRLAIGRHAVAIEGRHGGLGDLVAQRQGFGVAAIVVHVEQAADQLLIGIMAQAAGRATARRAARRDMPGQHLAYSLTRMLAFSSRSLSP